MPLLISQFSGGLSSGSKIGLAGAFRWGQGLNIHEDPDVLKISAKSTKDSGSTVVDLVKFASTNTINSNIYFLGTKLYKKSSGVYSVLNTYTTPQGMGWFNGTSRIVFVAGNTEYKLDPSNDSITNGRALNTADFHPAEAFLDKIFIGNNQELISTDASGIDYDYTTVGGGIKIEQGYSIRCLKNVGEFLFIGATSNNSSMAKAYIWDGTSEFWNYSFALRGEDGVNAVEVSDNGTVLISCGKSGSLYQLAGLDTNFVKIKKLPRIEKDKTIEIYPQAICNYQGGIRFGLSDGTSLTAERGIYSYTSSDKNYPQVLNLDYVPSHGNTTGTDIQIGCILSANTTDMYVSWKSGSDYGIDLISGANVQGTAIYESLIFDAGKPFSRKHIKKLKITLAKAMEANEIIELFYKADRASWVSIDTISFATDGAIKEKKFAPDIKCREYEIKLEFTNTGTTAPEVDSILLDYIEEDLI